jgi:flagellar basal-body rod modification protein FlgD
VTAPVGSSSNSAPTTPATTATAPVTVDKNMFLQLLVAQLRNQDPLNPSDGTQFVAQLAQFQQLEQTMNTGQDIAAMRQDLDHLASVVNTGSNT